MIAIPREEFSGRIRRIQESMAEKGLDALMVYGDEYRKEQLRYVCGFWPIFERGACFLSRQGEPIVVGAPEGEKYAREMSAWPDEILRELRLIKSDAEIACLREAGRLACVGYEQLIAHSVPGNTELMGAAAGEGAARAAGAEAITFMVYGSGPRTATIIGRPTGRVICDGDMIMAAMAVQYQGYVATVEYPFVAGKASDAQKRLLEGLFEAARVQLGYLKDGAISGEMVRAVKAVFARRGLTAYDVYPPMHGIGLAEAESPYPDERATCPLRAGMCVNSDISLFGHPAGSNRIEEGFVITREGPASITPYIRQLCEAQVVSTDDLLHA